MLFGQPPESYASSLNKFAPGQMRKNITIPDHPIEKIFYFQNPSQYFFYDVFPDGLTREILRQDYQLIKEGKQ